MDWPKEDNNHWEIFLNKGCHDYNPVNPLIPFGISYKVSNPLIPLFIHSNVKPLH